MIKHDSYFYLGHLSKICETLPDSESI